MKTSNMGLFAIAASIAFAGPLLAGVPLASLAPILILLGCPLMMIFMMKGMHGSGSDHRDADERRDQHTHR